MDRKEKLNRIFLILLSLFVVMLGYGILLPTLPYYTERLAFNSTQVGIGSMLCGSIMAILKPVFATYGEKILSTKNQIALGLLIAGISLISFPFFKNEFLVYGLIVLLAPGGAMVTPNLI